MTPTETGFGLTILYVENFEMEHVRAITYQRGRRLELDHLTWWV